MDKTFKIEWWRLLANLIDMIGCIEIMMGDHVDREFFEKRNKTLNSEFLLHTAETTTTSYSFSCLQSTPIFCKQYWVFTLYMGLRTHCDHNRTNSFWGRKYSKSRIYFEIQHINTRQRLNVVFFFVLFYKTNSYLPRRTDNTQIGFEWQRGQTIRAN